MICDRPRNIVCRLFFIALGLLTIAQMSYSDSLGQGYELVVVDDGEDRHCINAKKDHVSISIDRLVVPNKRDVLRALFATDNAVDIVLDVDIEGRRDADYRTYGYSIPIRDEKGIEASAPGTVVIPLSIALMSQYPLSREGHTVHRLGVEFSFINAADPTLLSMVLAELPDASRGAQIIGSQYTSYLGEVSSILSNIVDAIIRQRENRNAVRREGSLSFVFHKGTCERQAAYSGTYLYVRSYDSGDSGVVALDEIHNHCFAKLGESAAVYFERKAVNGECSYSDAALKRLVNPHFTVTVSITNEIEDSRDSIESKIAKQRAGR